MIDAINHNLNISEYAIESTNRNFEILKSKGYNAKHMTFENFYEKIAQKDDLDINRVIMNPPFSCQRDITHTMMAYDLLNQDGILVAIISKNSLYYKTDKTIKFNKFLKDTGAIIEPVEYGAFKESGTTVDTIIINKIRTV